MVLSNSSDEEVRKAFHLDPRRAFTDITTVLAVNVKIVVPAGSVIHSTPNGRIIIEHDVDKPLSKEQSIHA